MKLLAAAIGSACALALSACSLPFTGPPAAQDILSRPAGSGLTDAHFAIAGTPGEGTAGVDVDGDGDVVFTPAVAVHMIATTLVGSAAASQEMLLVGGASYQRVGDGRWEPAPSAIPPSSFDPWVGAAHPAYAGEETVDGSRTWHVTATSAGMPLDLWVRESDSYPQRVRIGQLVIDYGKFNGGVRIAAPTGAQLEPPAQHETSGSGATVHLTGVDVSVGGVDLNYVPADRSLRPPAGVRLVVALVTYTDTGTGPVSYGPVQWQLTDAAGASFPPAFSDRQPALGLGQLTARGTSVRGYLTYRVPATGVTGLQLEGSIDLDTVQVRLQ